MKTFCQSHCTIFGKKKIVVIDDIDIVNEQSQQVFRNYIDKYKNNVHFISSCSNIQKVIENLQSRLHIIHIPSHNQETMRMVMEKIIQEESLQLDDISKEYLLQLSNHSLRNIINNLEKIYILGEPVDLPLCKKICSNISFHLFEQFFNQVREKDINGSIKVIYNIYDYGYSVIDILDYLFIFIKTTNLLNEDEKYKLIPIVCRYITIFHNIHEDVIELSFFTKEVISIIV
jgi:DNA polymerase III delta prime subunit